MITAVNPEPAIPKTTTSPDYRHRQAAQPPLLPDATSNTPKSPSTGDYLSAADSDAAGSPTPAPARKDSSAMFAAAVIAGALSPRPKTMEELMLRIGTSAIPEESEARLRDLMA